MLPLSLSLSPPNCRDSKYFFEIVQYKRKLFIEYLVFVKVPALLCRKHVMGRKIVPHIFFYRLFLFLNHKPDTHEYSGLRGNHLRPLSYFTSDTFPILVKHKLCSSSMPFIRYGFVDLPICLISSPNAAGISNPDNISIPKNILLIFELTGAV